MALTVVEVAGGEEGDDGDSPGPIIKASHLSAEQKHAR